MLRIISNQQLFLGLILDAESVSVKGEVMEVVKLSCMVTANPKPSFEWRKPDNSTSMYYVSFGTILVSM